MAFKEYVLTGMCYLGSSVFCLGTEVDLLEAYALIKNRPPSETYYQKLDSAGSPFQVKFVGSSLEGAIALALFGKGLERTLRKNKEFYLITFLFSK